MLSQSIREIRSCLNFEELIKLMGKKIGNIPGIGQLTVYDTALRIGANLGIEPKIVYLHCGTRVGAKTLGINIRKKDTLNPSELPDAFSKLSPSEIEDCLCIYKGALSRIKF
jgi:hypothetical protein